MSEIFQSFSPIKREEIFFSTDVFAFLKFLPFIVYFMSLDFVTIIFLP